MEVRKAAQADRPAIDALYAGARRRMRESGNPHQWGSTRPAPEVIAADIERGQCYLVVEGNAPVGVFAFFVGEDPTYRVIEGSWVGGAPYAVLHRVASDGVHRGILAAAVSFAAASRLPLRMDTHADNHIMQAALQKCGFQYRGIIYLEDGSPRRAYERSAE
ncbi:MAG: N-acetyltransferase [bacterium]